MKILVTGGTHGMGKGVAKILAGIDNRVHEIIILCRSQALGESVTQEINNTSRNQKVSLILCDLTHLSDVKRAIREIQSQHQFLDCIFINAGLGYAAKRVETEDGLDPHFQVNYLSQFMLTLNLLNLLEKSKSGGRVIFNATAGGEINWTDLQMKTKWSYEAGIHQAMVAKRMLLAKLHALYQNRNSKIAFIGFQIPKTVWTNQVNIIPSFMRFMATVMKFFGTFISIDQCGEIIAPLFTENQAKSLEKSGKLITWKDNQFIEIKENVHILNPTLQNQLWQISLKLCGDDKTSQISKEFHHL